MSVPNPDWGQYTWRQLLAAAADGEVDRCTLLRVRAWLDQHPELESSAAAQQDFSPTNCRFWNAVEPPQPSTNAWMAIRERIEFKVANPVVPASRKKRGVWVAGLLAVATAAMLFLFMLPKSSTPPVPVDSVREEIMPIAHARDVEIHSIRTADEQQLVVGAAPVTETLALATTNDVRLDGLAPAWDGLVPQIQHGDASLPMIFPPLARNP